MLHVCTHFGQWKETLRKPTQTDINYPEVRIKPGAEATMLPVAAPCHAQKVLFTLCPFIRKFRRLCVHIQNKEKTNDPGAQPTYITKAEKVSHSLCLHSLALFSDD